jgi:SAM-dependent methyltransferase
VQLFQQEGTTCCYAKADKFWIKDADGIPWEMYALLADVEAETASDGQLRTFLGQQVTSAVASEQASPGGAATCCVPGEMSPSEDGADDPRVAETPMSAQPPARADIREAVRRRYGAIAVGETPSATAQRIARTVGYSDRELDAVPEGANLGLGCGNPVAVASLQPGEVVLDLGSGAGFDALLAARAVGSEGHVIGVDMTQEMIEKARTNATKLALPNVEFRLGTIEALPVDDASVDVIISNCVINLSPDKPAVFREAFRTLRPGGRLMISDLVALGELPATVRASMPAYLGCVAGVSLKEDYLTMLRGAGFHRIEVVGEKSAAAMLGGSDIAQAACACADPTVSGLVSELVKSVPPADLMEAARLVVSVQFAAYK